MRFAITGFLVVIICAVALSKPTTPSTPCGKECLLDYTPICAKSKLGTGVDLSFGSQCVLDKYNCEHASAEYIFKDKGECPGAVGIRLQ